MDSNYVNRARTHLEKSILVKTLVMQACLPVIVESAKLIAHAFLAGRKLLLCGNGGSAADCQHMATEFTCRLTKHLERRALPAIALTTDTSFLTAYPNDYAFEGIFARQVEALGEKDDVLIGISTSGNSPNVLRAIEQAKVLRLKTISLSGEIGKIPDISTLAIRVPSAATNLIQESHITIEHIICDLVEQQLFVK